MPSLIAGNNRCMRCPVLIGRDLECSVLSQAVTSARQGGGAAIVLVGGAGIGKTRLAQHAVGVADHLGVRVLLGRAVQSTVALPVRPVADALLSATRTMVPPASDHIRPYLPLLATLVPHWRTEGWRAPDDSLLMTAEAVLRLLGELHGTQGLLLVLEDLHWADEATVPVTQYLIQHGAEVGTSLLVTVREGDGRWEVAGELEQAGARMLHLGPLGGSEVRDMVAACGGASIPAEVVARVERDAEGNPLLIEDLLSLDDAGAVPRRFADTVNFRMAALAPEHRDVVAAAAVFRRAFTIDAVAMAAGCSVDVTAAALYRAAAFQLVTDDPGGFGFRHALTREVVLDGLGASERAALCASAADALKMQSPSPSFERDLDIAELLAESGRRHEAAGLLVQTGRSAEEGGDLGLAIAALRRASALDDRDPAEADAGCELARVLLLAGNAADATDVATELLARTDGRSQARTTALRLLCARAAAACGRWDDAAAARNMVARQCPHDPAVVAEIAVLDAQLALVNPTPGQRNAAEHLARSAVASARRAARPDLSCEALESVGLAARARDLDAAIIAFDQALLLAEEGGFAAHRLRILNELGTAEMLRDARPDRLALARAEALRAGALGLAAAVAANLAAVHIMTGRFDDGMAIAKELGVEGARLRIPPLQAAAELMAGLAMAHQGRRWEMDDHLARAEALAPDDRDLCSGAWALGRGLLALLEEDRDACRRALARARQESPDVHVRILNPFEGPELLLRAVDGDVERTHVASVASRQVVGARWAELWTGCALAVVCGAEGADDEAADALTHALDRGSRYPVLSAIACRLVAEAALGASWCDPVGLLRRAEATFDQLGTPRIAAACRGLLKQSGNSAPRRRAGTSVPAELRAKGVTPREAEVLGLLADRLTNREIGQHLFTSPRTVEKHVAALIQKLAVPGRGALAEIGRSLQRP